MRVDHGGRHIRMPQQLLHRADVGARLQQVRGEGMAQGVDGRQRGRREQPEPAAGVPHFRVFLFQSVRRLHTATPGFCVCVPHGAGLQQLSLEYRRQRLRQHHHPVLATLTVTHHDHPAIKVHILDAKTQTLHQPHARAVQELRQQSHFTVEKTEQGGYLIPREHTRDALLLRRAVQTVEPGQAHRQHFPVQKEDCAERLVVGGRRSLPLIGQHFEERFHLNRAHLARMAHHPTAAMPANEKNALNTDRPFPSEGYIASTGCAPEAGPRAGWM
jgi:hypothetical protein